ncbi:hypothetical protein KC363_g6956 [Hortaea werneckii]|nr:hypothetical protein KC361_g3692 [Hortaea werneckii]KAI6880476.1 hypothetical protein KC325_g7211 [Hortaea werneckii]KAI6995287.1 hypothetical protein KC359_g4172 [Hortaea werneckii]KAI7142431.1 hypothetical protein KC344_g7201 [Hortaea werneckii]KAI7169874.1 hypothetical protein KC360_g7213 [Hortaea werneckii]
MFASTLLVAVGAALASLTNAFPIVEHPAQLMAVTATPSPRVDGREAQVLASVPTPSARLEGGKDKDDGVETIHTLTPTRSAALAERHDHTDDGVITIYTYTPTRFATLVERHHHTDDGVVSIHTLTPTPTPRVWPTPSPTDLGMTIYTYTPTLSASLSARDEKDGTLTILTLPPTQPADPEKIEGGDGTLKIWTLPPTRTADPVERRGEDGTLKIWTFPPTRIPHATLAREPRAAEASPLPARNEQAEPHPLLSIRMMIKPGCDVHWTDDRFCSYDEPGHHHHDKRDAGEAGMSDVPGYYHEDTFKPVCWPEGNGPKPKEYSDVADCGVLSESGQVEPSVSQVNQKLAVGGHRVICSERATENGPSATLPRCEELQGAVDGAARLATGFSDAEKQGFRVHVSADKGHGPMILKIVLAGQSLAQLTTAASMAVDTNVLEERQIFVDGKVVPLEMAPGPLVPPPDMPPVSQSSTTGTSTTTGPSSVTDQTSPAPEKPTETQQEVKTGSAEPSAGPTSTSAPQQASPSPAPESTTVGNAVNTTALPHGQLLSEALQELIDGIDREKAHERHNLPALVSTKDTAKGTQQSATTSETMGTPSSSA